MKSLVLALILSTLTFSIQAENVNLDLRGELLFESAVQKFLNDSEIEVYDIELKFVNNTSVMAASFSYTKEFFNPYAQVEYKCTGTAVGSFIVTKLNCEEEEPTLWDEF